jgi:hypothetical protein
MFDIIKHAAVFVGIKMQMLWDHGGFHPDYKRRPENSDIVWKDRCPCEELLRGEWMKLCG